jgi:hypothetical protein
MNSIKETLSRLNALVQETCIHLPEAPPEITGRKRQRVEQVDPVNASSVWVKLKPEVIHLSETITSLRVAIAKKGDLEGMRLIEDGLSACRDSMVRFYEKRGDLIVKIHEVCGLSLTQQHPEIEDYELAIKELEETQFSHLLATMSDIRAAWVSLQ